MSEKLVDVIVQTIYGPKAVRGIVKNNLVLHGKLYGATLESMRQSRSHYTISHIPTGNSVSNVFYPEINKKKATEVLNAFAEMGDWNFTTAPPPPDYQEKVLAFLNKIEPGQWRRKA